MAGAFHSMNGYLEMCNHTKLEIQPSSLPREIPGNARCSACKAALPYVLVAGKWEPVEVANASKR